MNQRSAEFLFKVQGLWKDHRSIPTCESIEKWNSLLEKNFKSLNELRVFLRHIRDYLIIDHDLRKEINGIISHIPSDGLPFERLEGYLLDRYFEMIFVKVVFCLHHLSHNAEIGLLEKHFFPIGLNFYYEFKATKGILAGDDVENRNRVLIDEAHIIILWLCPDLIASETTYLQIQYMYDHLYPNKKIIPVIAKPFLWKEFVLSKEKKIFLRNIGVIELNNYPDQHTAFLTIADNVSLLLRTI
jgi:hypothetical protein